MRIERISNKQEVFTIILFVVGVSSIFTTGIEAGNDLWLSVICSVIFAIPAVAIYARINYLYPGKDLFDILEICFGKILGKIVGLLYVWFAFHLSSLVVRDFGEFYVTVAAPETPMIVPMLFVTLLNIWIIKEGIETIGKFVEIYVPFIIGLIIITVLLLIPQMEIDNLKPLLYNGIKPVLKGAFTDFSFPFGEIVIFTMIFSSIKKKGLSHFKIYFSGLFISGFIILISSTTDLLVLGADRVSEVYFPSYDAVRRLNVGNFIQRMEIVVSVVFLIGGFVKLSVCSLAACKGLTKVFGFKDYRFIVTPVALVKLNLAYLISDSIMDFISWSTHVWKYYAFPFQVVLPVIIVIVAEVKSRKSNLKKT
ncbi:MAG: spore gernimation protein [Firmicutes bacterium]|nr:spore gernimation protein [Bacillota bacterium]